MGKNHVALGLISLVTVQAVAKASGHPLVDPVDWSLFGIPIPEVPFMLFPAAVGSLLPDIDHPNSRIANYKMGGIPIFKPAAFVTNLAVGHRGATHSLFFLGILSLVLAILGWQFGLTYLFLAFAFGYFMHLVGDSLTRSGVPWLWPFYTKSFGFPFNSKQRFETGSIMEHLVIGLVMVVSASVLLKVGLPL